MARAAPAGLRFDVDGTLIASDGAGKRALEKAFAACHGRDEPCLRFSLGGMTDRAIARAGLVALGIDATEPAIDAVLAAYVGFLDAELRAASTFRVHAGVVAALDAAARHAGVAIGLGTGNVRAGAQKKLGHAKLWDRFPFGGFADDSEDRNELIRRGAERGAERLGESLSRCRVVVIGDTLLDIAAARSNGFEAFAVATGNVPFAELEGGRPDFVCESLAAAAVLERLLGRS